MARGNGSLARIVVAAAAVGAVSNLAFVGMPAGSARLQRTSLRAEEAAAPKGESVALVKVTEENKTTAAGTLAGVAGLLVGGVWVGAAAFAVSSYIARKEDDDVAKALKGIAAGGLEVLNFASYVNNKYTVTDKIGSAVSEAVDKAKASSSPDTVSSVESVFDGISDAVTTFDKDVGIKDTIGSILTSGGELAAQAVDKAIELNDQYKITDQIKEKIDEATSSATKKA